MRHRKKHRRTKWTRELAWKREVAQAMSCWLLEEVALAKGETYVCTCEVIKTRKAVW